MEGRRLYRFTIRLGEERETDDAEGRAASISKERPRRTLPRAATGLHPPDPADSAAFRRSRSRAERAHDLARDGEEAELAARPVEIARLDWSPPRPRSCRFGSRVRQRTMRSLARDLGRALGCCGHVSDVPRVSAARIREKTMIPLEELEAVCHRAASGEGSLADLMPVETALDDIPALAVSWADAARLQRGQAVLLRGRDAPNFRGMVYVTVSGQLLALAELDRGEIVPKRVFNLAGLMGRAARKKG